MPSRRLNISGGRRDMNVSSKRTSSASLNDLRFSSSKDVRGDVNMNDLLNENGELSLSVVLPDQKVKVMDVNPSTPMMDLLVQVASGSKLRPGEHVISAVSEETGRTIDYKSSQTIGTLGVNKIYLLNKAMQKKQRENEVQKQKDASKFEQTIRVTVNMPRGVKSLQRLNPTVPIMDLFRKICLEKGLDPSRYEVRLTKHPHTTVDMSQTLSDYQANEISIKQCAAPDFHSSMIDISRPTSNKHQSNGATKMADPFEKVKKKKGLFSFLSRKDKSKSKKLEESRNFSQSVQALPTSGDITMAPRKPQAQVKPQPKIQPPTIQEEHEEDDIIRNKAKRAPSKKKYRAPAPPSRPLSTMVTISEEKKTPMYASTPNLMTGSASFSAKEPAKPKRSPADHRNHSRNSSDSSGYHEPPITPPDTLSSRNTAEYSSLPRSGAQNTRPTSQVETKKPVGAAVQRSQTLPSGATAAPPSKRGGKKKAAPAPPPTGKAKAPSPQVTLHDKIIESEEETGSISTQGDDDFAPEMGIVTPNTKAVQQNPPIFIPPPPPETPPPPAISESPHRENPMSSREFPSDRDSNLSREVTPEPDSAALYNRSESRCSRSSVNTIDDVQQYFDLAIAAGESQLRHEQGSLSPVSNNGAANEEVSKITEEMASLTSNLQLEDEPVKLEKGKPAEPKEPSQEDINDAVAQIDMCFGDDEGSDGSLVPDGENFVVAASKLPAGGEDADPQGSVRSNMSESGYAKPVEELSYGFDNPFRSVVPPAQIEDSTPVSVSVSGGMKRRDSQISDSTLPDSEHTDRPQSSSLQSSGLQSDEEESVTTTADGYDTSGTGPVSQSETETSTQDITDSPLNASQFVPKTEGRGMFVEAKGQEVNKVIYGDIEAGSVRGVPGQVKHRAASFAAESPESPERKPVKVRPKSVFNILTTTTVTSDAPKRRSAYAAVKVEAEAIREKPKDKPDSAKQISKESDMSLQSKPLPVYSATKSPTEPVKPLAAVIADSVKSGEASRSSMKKVPEQGSGSKLMYFKANRNSRSESTTTDPGKIENVVKLDTAKFSSPAKSSDSPSKTLPAQQPSVEDKKVAKSPPPVANKPKPGATSLNRKESLKDQYNKLQENMAKWQNKLKNNEDRVKELTTSQQNLSSPGLSVPPSSNGTSSTSKPTANSSSKRPFSDNSSMYKSVPTELHKVTLRSAADRVIIKAEPQLDPVENLMASIRTRGGRTADDKPDRGIYVASGEQAEVAETIAQREIAPTVLSSPTNGAVPQPPAPPPAEKSTNKRYSRDKMMNGTSKANDPRFNPAPNPRDSLLAEIAGAKGKPSFKSKRHTIAVDSSSQSSSDELREIEVRHKPQKSRHKNSKRSVSDPFPPQQTNGRNHIQPTPTELDPREELMIAIRNSGGLSRLNQVNADEIKWSAQV